MGVRGGEGRGGWGPGTEERGRRGGRGVGHGWLLQRFVCRPTHRIATMNVPARIAVGSGDILSAPVQTSADQQRAWDQKILLIRRTLEGKDSHEMQRDTPTEQESRKFPSDFRCTVTMDSADESWESDKCECGMRGEYGCGLCGEYDCPTCRQAEADSEAYSDAETLPLPGAQEQMLWTDARRPWTDARLLVWAQEQMLWIRVKVRRLGQDTAEVEVPEYDGQGQVVTVPADIVVPGPPCATWKPAPDAATWVATLSTPTTEVPEAETTRLLRHHHYHYQHDRDHYHFHHHHYHRKEGCPYDSTTTGPTLSPHSQELTHAAPAPPAHSLSHFHPHDANPDDTNLHATAPTTPQGKKRRRSAEASSQGTPPAVVTTSNARRPGRGKAPRRRALA